jgi:hypothetical protein
MSEEAKQFMFGLDQCRGKYKAMKWHGKIPEDIVELFGLTISEVTPGYTIAGMYVTLVPRYEGYTPDWLEDK